MIRLLSVALAISTSLAAQCSGNYPLGTVDTGLPARCSELPGFVGPWVTFAGPVLANGNASRVYWSDVPFDASTGSIIALVAFDTAPQLAPLAIGSCSTGWIGDGLTNFGVVVSTVAGCQTANVLSYVPNPALAGLSFYGQGYMLDVGNWAWSASNAFQTTML